MSSGITQLSVTTPLRLIKQRIRHVCVDARTSRLFCQEGVAQACDVISMPGDRSPMGVRDPSLPAAIPATPVRRRRFPAGRHNEVAIPETLDDAFHH